MVIRNMKYKALAFVATVAGAWGYATAASFVPPRQGPVPIRRDRLPIGVDRMTTLSLDLTLLAQAQKQELPADRRATAQMLALAQALDPRSEEARTALDLFSKGNIPRAPDKMALERSRFEIWQTLGWLQSPGAGEGAKALAGCLADVIAFADPGHPAAAALLRKGEQGAWNGWIPPLAAYHATEHANVEQVKENHESLSSRTTENKLQLAAATLSTPLWAKKIDSEEVVLRLTPVIMATATTPSAPDAPPKPLSFSIEHTAENNIVIRMNRIVGAALARLYCKLPRDSQATFNLGGEVPYAFLRNRDALSGPAAVLMSAAITGKEPGGTVIGTVDAEGAFKMTPDFWERLRCLSTEAGGRLVIPAEAAEFLPSILALEDPEFFMKFDVLLASNLTELLERSAKVPAPPLDEVLARFQDIRAKGASYPIGQYVSNRFVRQRLMELSAEAAYFASPKMLAIQAAGERPTRLPRRLLAAELRRTLQPMAWIAEKPMADINLVELDQAYETGRTEIDNLGRYVDSNDRDFHLRVREMTTTLRTFSRASRVGVNRENGAATTIVAFEAMKKSYTATFAELNAAANPNAPATTPEDDAASQ